MSERNDWFEIRANLPEVDICIVAARGGYCALKACADLQVDDISKDQVAGEYLPEDSELYDFFVLGAAGHKSYN